MPYTIETPERETLSFLTKAWSENKYAKFRWAVSNKFRADTGHQIVFIANYTDSTSLPNLQGFDRWRVWRFLTLHESLHLLLSPKMLPKEYVTFMISQKKLALKLPDFELIEVLYRILEDVRIETIGLRTYIGYIPDERFHNATAFASFKRKVTDYPAGANKIHDTFHYLFLELESQLLFQTSIMPELKESWKLQAKAFSDAASQLTTQDSAFELASDIYSWIDSQIPHSQRQPVHSSDLDAALELILGWGQDLSEEEIKKAVEEQAKNGVTINDIREGTEDVRGEFDLLEHERKKLEKQSDDTNKTSSAFAHGTSSGQPVETIIPTPTVERWDTLMEGSSGVTSILKTTLRRWRVGWREVLSEEGDDLDAEAPILARFSNGQDHPKIFLDEHKVGSRGKLLLLVDMSGSIKQFTEPYLRAAGIISEALKFIGATFELYCFNESSGGASILHLLKTVNEPWSIEQKERLAQMEAKGGTPLDEILEILHARIKKIRISRLVILTDGNPNSIKDTIKPVHALTADGVRVMFMGIRNASIEGMKMMLEYKNVNRIAYIDELNELPQAFFRLLQASG